MSLRKPLSGSFRRIAGTSQLLLATTFVIAVFISACSKPPSESPGTSNAGAPKTKALKIGISFQELDNPYFAVMKQALDDAGKSLGAEIYITDARHDVTKQINDVEDLVQKGIDILLLNPTDSVGIESAVKSAKKAGVIVVAVDA